MLDKRIWIIFLIIFINMLGFGIILPLLPYYVESLGAGVITIGLVASVYSLFQLISAPIMGEISDKIGRRPILLFSLGGTVISFIILGFSNSILLLFISRIIDGISGGNISTAQAYIADITNKENRTQGMGIMMAAFSLGMILGPATGGFLSVYGYSVPAFVAAFVALIATILTYFFLPETIKIKTVVKVKKRKSPIFRLNDFYDALTHPEVGSLLIISFLMMFAFSLMQGTFAIFTQDSLGLTAKDNGIIFAYLGIIGVFMQLFLLKRILKLISERKATVISILFVAFALGMIAYSSNLIILLIAVTFLAFGNSISGPVLAGLISKDTPDDEQGNIAGMTQAVGSVARLIGPISGTLFYSQLGMKSPYLIATGILLITVFFGTKKLLLNKN